MNCGFDFVKYEKQAPWWLYDIFDKVSTMVESATLDRVEHLVKKHLDLPDCSQN